MAFAPGCTQRHQTQLRSAPAALRPYERQTEITAPCAPTQKRKEGQTLRLVVCFCNGKGCTICNGTGYMTLPYITYIDEPADRQEGK
jgi:hypothetical protein